MLHYLEHPELLDLSPLNRFPNLRTLLLRLRADSPALLYNLCRMTAALPQVTRLTITKVDTLGTVDTGTDDKPDVVEIAELLRHLPRNLQASVFTGFTARPTTRQQSRALSNSLFARSPERPSKVPAGPRHVEIVRNGESKWAVSVTTYVRSVLLNPFVDACLADQSPPSSTR